MEDIQLFKKLEKYCKSLPDEYGSIAKNRIETLEEIGKYIIERKKVGKEVKITVICTHNSRRSHLGQVWLKTAAEYFGVEGVTTYSGGTDATAFHPNAIACLERTGFSITEQDKITDKNLIYSVKAGENLEVGKAFSKRYDDAGNPLSEFAAIMVCTEADEACPIVKGADGRFSLPFEDPKLFDGSNIEAEKYDERCRQIAREMFYVMNYVSKNGK